MMVNKELNSEWRRVASTIYKKPTDSKILGAAEIDVTDLEDFITKQRKNKLKITLTHAFVLIVAKALKTEAPELNTFVRRGKIVPRKSIDAAVSVLMADESMTSIVIPEADTMNFAQLADFLRKEIVNSRKGDERTEMESKNLLANVPWPFRNWLYAIYSTITLKWGITVPGLGLDANSFGSFLISNIGTLGLDSGFPALLPSSNLSFVLVLGGVKKKPVVINDEIVIRKMMPITAVVDHRVSDAQSAGKVYRYIKYMIKHPEELL